MKQKMKLSLFIPLIALVLLASCVKNEVTSLTLSNATKSFNIGQTDSLIATVTGSGDISKFPVTWSTSNASVVSVTNGKIIAKSKGNATITAKSGEKEATCVVAVSNEIYPVTTLGEIHYLGDAFKAKVSNAFFVILYSKSDTLVLQINTSLSVSNSLPVGKYQVLTVISRVEDIAPFTIMPGNKLNGKNYNSWYYGSIQQSIVEGNINVSTSNGIYTLEYDFFDFYRNKIYGTYQGTLRYFDETTATTPPSATKSVFKTRTTESAFNLFDSKMRE